MIHANKDVDEKERETKIAIIEARTEPGRSCDRHRGKTEITCRGITFTLKRINR